MLLIRGKGKRTGVVEVSEYGKLLLPSVKRDDRGGGGGGLSVASMMWDRIWEVMSRKRL